MNATSKPKQSRTRPFKILELVSMLKIAKQGIIICSYDYPQTLDFFRRGLHYVASKENIIINDIEQYKKMSLSKFIKTQLEYKNIRNNNQMRAISNIYDSGNIPTYESLNQSRNYYIKIDCPIIFWLHQAYIPWLYKLAHDFMRIQIASFQFKYKDAIDHSKFLKIQPSHLSSEEEKKEYFKKEMLSCYSISQYSQLRKLLKKFNNIFDCNPTEKDILNFAKEMIITKNENITSKIKPMMGLLYKSKDDDRIYEDKKFVKFYTKLAKECKKIGEEELFIEYKKMATIIENRS